MGRREMDDRDLSGIAGGADEFKQTTDDSGGEIDGKIKRPRDTDVERPPGTTEPGADGDDPQPFDRGL